MLVGSMAGEPDRWSDVDVAAVVADGADSGAVADDFQQRAYESLPVVHHFATAFGSTLVRGYLLENLLEVDVSFDVAAVQKQHEWGPAQPDWSGEAGFAWHDVLHAGAAVRRGKPWQALWYTERVRNRTLRLAQERHGYWADFFDYADELPAEERSLEAAIVRSVDPEELLRALEAATLGLIAELRRGDETLAEKLEKPLLEFVRLRS